MLLMVLVISHIGGVNGVRCICGVGVVVAIVVVIVAVAVDCCVSMVLAMFACCRVQLID